MNSEPLESAATAATILMTRAEVALMLRTSTKTLANWASAGIGPRSRKSGRTAVYLRSEIEEYIEAMFAEEAA